MSLGSLRGAHDLGGGHQRGELAGVERVRRGVVGRRRLDPLGLHEQRRQVGGQLRVVAHPLGERVRDPVQLVEQHAGVRGAQAAVAGGRPGDERVDVRRDARLEARRRRHVLVDVLVGDLDRALALVGLGAGQQLEEHHAGGVHVRARVGTAVDHQLGGEVGDGADQHPAGGGVLRVGADRAGQPEVGHLDPAVLGDEHVLGLDVAVDDAGPVGRGQGGQHRLDQRERPRRRHRALLADQVAQGDAVDQLHREEHRALVVALVVDRHHVRVRQPGGRPRLAHEAGRELGVVAEARVHDLHRDRAVEADVGGLVDTGHAATRDAGADPVATLEQPAGHGVASGVGARVGVPIGLPVWRHSDPPALLMGKDQETQWYGRRCAGRC
ncbi:hypothetical protein HIDPHFAB_03834 [Nocardioides sp. T2.26MG-1]|nr:hypothetical protein HIDPHFAB_03834 [Nocardioides sp. T2.26MG-1]